MNDIINNIYTRRSVRKFSDKRIPTSDLEIIADCARFAPSARNQQKWRFTVVHNREIIARIAEVMAKELDRPGYDFYKPDALILTTSEKDYAFNIEDNACAMQTIFLAAHSLGIGSVWINQFKGMCDRPAIRRELDSLGVPADHAVFGCAALGYGENPEGFKADKVDGNVTIIE